MNAQLDYWMEALNDAASEVDLNITPEQLLVMAKNIEGWYENYGMAFYSPPAGDMVSESMRGHKESFIELQKEFDTYRNNAENVIRDALGVSTNTPIRICENGDVFRYG